MTRTEATARVAFDGHLGTMAKQPERVLRRLGTDRDQLDAFCKRWRLERLGLFGSVLREDFGSESDIDVVLYPEEGHRHSLSDLLQIEEELETLFARKVDAITRRALNDPLHPTRTGNILKTIEMLHAKR